MKKGFTLIEMMIVVAIIAIIASIAIPSLLAARRNSLETNAIGSMRTYCGAQVMYRRNAYADPVAPVAGTIRLAYANPMSLLHFQQDSNGDNVQLIDAAFANADLGSATIGAHANVVSAPKQGYFFGSLDNIEDAAGVMGAIDWVNDFGLCGIPSQYGRTGYQTFIVSTLATVYQQDRVIANTPPLIADLETDYPNNPSAEVPPWFVCE